MACRKVAWLACTGNCPLLEPMKVVDVFVWNGQTINTQTWHWTSTKRYVQQGRHEVTSSQHVWRAAGNVQYTVDTQSELFNDVVHSHQLLALIHQLLQLLGQLWISEELCTVNTHSFMTQTSLSKCRRNKVNKLKELLWIRCIIRCAIYFWTCFTKIPDFKIIQILSWNINWNTSFEILTVKLHFLWDNEWCHKILF